MLDCGVGPLNDSPERANTRLNSVAAVVLSG